MASSTSSSARAFGNAESPSLAPSPTSSAPHKESHSTSKPAASARPRPLTTPLAISPNVAAADSNSRQPSTKITMASVLSPAPPAASAKGPVSVTSKEWVIPPRPKPGRKPATDTPPTKRKAQNRAAQRAFRERRAARVGELEEQLEEQNEDHQREQQKLKDRIQTLELEAQTLKTRCQVLENMLERERFERRKWSDDVSLASSRRESVTLMTGQNPTLGRTPFASIPPSYQTVSPTRPYGGSEQTPLGLSSAPGQRTQTHSFSISQIVSPPEDTIMQTPLACGSCAADGPCICAEDVLANAVIGCGNCSLGTKCACLEATINATMGTSDLKRPHRPESPSSMGPGEKRMRSDPAMETDFTAFFSQKKLEAPVAQAAPRPYLPLPIQQSIPPRDSCGFCSEGTYCVCADAMAPILSTAPPLNLSMPPTDSTRQVQTPPPSETDAVPPPLEVTATGAIKLPSFKAMRFAKEAATRTTSTCGPGGPGTCAQCLADPKSGLFCRSLAASLKKSGQSGGGGCCGGGGPGGCCKKQPGKAEDNKPASIGLSISCADTYKTLSSHRNFNKATDEIATWLPMLRAAPKPQPMEPGTSSARPAMDVEAASIMSVLKGFDVRFGSGN